MCGKKPPPQYQGKTYRRELVTDLSQYSGAWQNGDKSQLLGDNIVAESQRAISTNNPFGGQQASIGGFKIPTSSVSPQGIWGLGAITGKPRTYTYGQHLNDGVYGADDGSFLQSTHTKGNYSPWNIGGKTNDSVATYRYIEDVNGTYGVKGFGDKGIPTDFMDISGYQRFSMSSDKYKVKPVKKEASTAPVPTTSQGTKRSGSVGTSRFRIDIGGTTGSSGLGIPR